MALEPAYLEYPLRRRGMDHDLYCWSSIFDRPPLQWERGRKLAVAIVISLEWFPLIAGDSPFRAPGHMQTAYPDFRHYTARDYGARVGIYRLLDALDRVGAKASVAANSAIAVRYPSLIKDIVAAGHEIVAHSTDMNGTVASGLEESAERGLIATSLDQLERATGARPAGWLSIARSQSWNSPRLLAEAGVRYMCDWVNDDLPYRMSTEVGPIVNVPVNHELSDRQIVVVQQNSADSFAEQIEDAANWLAQEPAPRMLPVHVTPYIMGLPYRIGAFERLLGALAGRSDASFLTTGEIASALR